MTPDRRRVLRALAVALASAGVGDRAYALTTEAETRAVIKVVGALLSAAYNPLFAADAIASSRASFAAKYPAPSGPLPNPFTGVMQTYPFGGGYNFGDWMFDPNFPGKPPVAAVLGEQKLTLWRADLAKLEPSIRTQLNGIVVHLLVNSITAKFGAEKNPGSGHKVEVGAPNTTAGANIPSCDVTVFCPT